MLTIFSIPKPFKDPIGVIQHNAIGSWTRLLPKCEIILFGDETGVSDTARELNISHISQVEHNKFGTPLLNTIFEQVKQIAHYELICYVNSDIILLQDFIKAISRIHLPEFLMVGQRWDLDIHQPLTFDDPHWMEALQHLVRTNGVLHPPSGSDYFVFPRKGNLHLTLPFAVGRPAWDNWFIYQARRLRIPVVDATQVTAVIHQNHDYGHVPEQTTHQWEGPEAEANRQLTKGWKHVFTLSDATHQLTEAALRPAWGRRYFSRRWETLPVLWPGLAPLWKMWEFGISHIKKAGRVVLRRNRIVSDPAKR